jgi:putative transposase
VSRASLHRWSKRLEPNSRRPHHPLAAIERLRQDYHMWGGAKIGPLVRTEGFAVCDATVGRIITRAAAVP